jgi:hypothetical protein
MSRARARRALLLVTAPLAIALVVLLATAGVLSDIVSGPSRGPAKLLVGVQDDPVFVRPASSYGGRGTGQVIPAQVGYERLATLGVHVLRIAVHWAEAEPSQAAAGAWGMYDAAIARARAAGLTVQLALTGPAPAFATADHLIGVNEPSASAYAQFVQAAATRYRGRVSTYSIWNEPNWWNLLQPDASAPRLYRGLYEAGYAAVKRADPHALVLIGELAPMGVPGRAIPPLRFLREVACNARSTPPRHPCTRLVADGVALHPYTLRWPPTYPGGGADDATTGSLRRLVHALAALARAGALSTASGEPPPIYLTEYGWHAQRKMSESQRATFAASGFALAAREPQVKEMIWYQLAAPPPNRQHIWDTALLTNPGTPRPVFNTLREWIANEGG